MTGWLGVVSAEHVRRGVSLGIAQLGHGTRGGLAHLHPGDTLIYYSPVERLGDRGPLRQFTAFRRIADDQVSHADRGDLRAARGPGPYPRCRPPRAPPA